MDGPSGTAHETAVLRAAHQVIDRPRVLDDPLSMRILGETLPAAVRAEMVDRRRRASARAAVAARGRFAEDHIADAADAGIRRCVFVAAGAETFAYRNPYGPHLEVVEVDHPSTQAWKLECLAGAAIEIPSWVTFVAADLTRVRVGDALVDAGLRLDRAAIVVALGAMDFLPPVFLSHTIELVATLPPPSALVIDYDVVGAFRAELETSGFTRIEDLDVDAINERYFADRTDGLHMGPSGGHLLAAWT